MKVRQIIHSGGFEPEEVKLLEAVFDASWRQVEGHYPAEGTERDAARERLAAGGRDAREYLPPPGCGRTAN